MSFQLSRRDVDSAYAYANKNMRRVRDPEEHGSGALSTVFRTGKIVAGAAAVGVARGRFGSLNIGSTPVPLDLAAGISGHLIAFWLDKKGVSNHIHDVSNGVLAGYAAIFGRGYGLEMRGKAGLPPTVGGDSWDSGSFIQPTQQLPGEPQYDIVGAVGVYDSGFAADIVGRNVSPLSESELAALAQQVR